MQAVVKPDRRTEKLDLRISPSAKRKLQTAAAVSHRSVSDFVTESALDRADQLLADRRVFALDEARWAAFQAALDAPAVPRARLQALLNGPRFFPDRQP